MPTKPTTSGSVRSEEHTSELQSLTDISYAVFCLKKKTAIIRSNCAATRRAESGHCVTELPWQTSVSFFFFIDTATPEIYTSVNTLSLHDALPISLNLPSRLNPPHLATTSSQVIV